MAQELDPVDVVTVGVGWTGGIIAKELAEEGYEVVGLERGGERSTEDWLTVHDELGYALRYKLMQDLSRETITFRHEPGDTALPMRRYGASFREPASAGPAFTGTESPGASCPTTSRSDPRRSIATARRRSPRRCNSRTGGSPTRNSSPTSTSSSTWPASRASPATSRARSRTTATPTRGRGRGTFRCRR